MKENVRIEIVIALSVLLVVAGYFYFINEEAFNYQLLEQMEIEIPDDDFVRFAIVVSFLYDMLPTVAQQISIGAISVQLLLTGFSPVLLAIISALGLLAGQMILYVVGMFVKRIHKGSFGNLGAHNKFLHKYHFLVYLIIPFIGIVGDAGMLVSGHQRINPLKIIPFLFMADLASTARWIIPTVAELELGNHLQS